MSPLPTPKNEIALALEFLSALHDHNIRYCHWKNNDAIAEVVTGTDDWDLLVEQSYFPKFLDVISNLGFKKFRDVRIEFPGVSHFYGMDRASGVILHLHVYKQIITGESHTKNFHLPLEAMLLSETEQHELGLTIPIVEAEVIVFVIRYFIKISCLPGAYLLFRRKGAVKSEWETISAKSPKDERIRELLKTYISFIDADHFFRIKDSLENQSLFQQVKNGFGVRRKVRSLRRWGAVRDVYERYKQIGVRAWLKFTGRTGKVCPDVGKIIAFTGIDTSGKSSMASAVTHVLGSTFDVKRMHVGKPNAVFWSCPLRLAIRLKKANKRTSAGESNSAVPAKVGLAYALRYAVLAHERSVLLKRVARLRDQGFIVICDRYPSLSPGKMDSPRLSEQCGLPGLVGVLARHEAKCYATSPVPELIVNLKVSLPLALERNRARQGPDRETDDAMRRRYELNSTLCYNAKHRLDVDSSAPLEENLPAVLQQVWSHI